MDFGLQGKVAVVTGGGSGIGLAVIRLLLDEGAHVVTGDLNLAEVAHLDVDALELDLMEPASPARLVAAGCERYGRLDIVINAVGGPNPRSDFLSIADRDWEQSLALNFFCMVRTIRAAVPWLRRGGAGAIVSIASDAGREPSPMFVDYAVAKAAVICLSKAISLEFASDGIRSNVVTPGPTRTKGFVERFASVAKQWGMDDTEVAIGHYVNNVRELPLRRLGTPEEVAAVIVFLASDAAANVTGAEYRVDGGVIRAP